MPRKRQGEATRGSQHWLQLAVRLNQTLLDQAIAQAFGILERGSEVERILRADSAEYAFAFERHSELFRVLGLPDAAAGVGYAYIADGDLSGALSAEDFLHIT